MSLNELELGHGLSCNKLRMMLTDMEHRIKKISSIKQMEMIKKLVNWDNNDVMNKKITILDTDDNELLSNESCDFVRVYGDTPPSSPDNKKNNNLVIVKESKTTKQTPVSINSNNNINSSTSKKIIKKSTISNNNNCNNNASSLDESALERRKLIQNSQNARTITNNRLNSNYKLSSSNSSLPTTKAATNTSRIKNNIPVKTPVISKSAIRTPLSNRTHIASSFSSSKSKDKSSDSLINKTNNLTDDSSNNQTKQILNKKSSSTLTSTTRPTTSTIMPPPVCTTVRSTSASLTLRTRNKINITPIRAVKSANTSFNSDDSESFSKKIKINSNSSIINSKLSSTINNSTTTSSLSRPKISIKEVVMEDVRTPNTKMNDNIKDILNRSRNIVEKTNNNNNNNKPIINDNTNNIKSSCNSDIASKRRFTPANPNPNFTKSNKDINNNNDTKNDNSKLENYISPKRIASNPFEILIKK